MQKIIDKFENDKSIFVFAFINFYGESNSDYIINKVKNVDIIWHDSTSLKDKDDTFEDYL